MKNKNKYFLYTVLLIFIISIIYIAFYYINNRNNNYENIQDIEKSLNIWTKIYLENNIIDFNSSVPSEIEKTWIFRE